MGLIDGIYRYGQDRLLPLDYLFPYLTSHEVGAELVAVGLGTNLSVYHVADAQQEPLLEPTRLAVGDAVERGQFPNVVSAPGYSLVALRGYSSKAVDEPCL